MKTYRSAFFVALAGNVLLAGALGYSWWRSHASGERLTLRSVLPQAIRSVLPEGMQPATPNTASPAAAIAPAEPALAPVQISPQRLQSIGVKHGRVQRRAVADEIRTAGNVAMDETRLSYVQVRFPGFIQKVFVDATYQYVRQGQALFTIYSPELVATEREYLVAKQNQQQVAHSTVPGVASGAASLLEAAVERLKQWDVPQTEINRLESTGEVRKEIEIDARASGYITERRAYPGTAVQPDMRLYAIADLSTVWVNAQVFQNDLAQVKVDAPATITADTYPGRTLTGRVDFIYPDIDMATRTARVRIVLHNPDPALSPGMFVRVAFKVLMGEHLVIPASGVLQSGTRQIAFVERGDGYLEPRDVQLGARVGDDLIVLKGLKEGEQIVTSANFLIDSESQLQASLGAYTPPPPGAGNATVINAPQVNAEMTSQPEPPHKGSNVFRVKLSDSKGTPVSGAQVSVNFLMPAMPAMGMAAMRTDVKCSDKGNGLYEGSGQLASGGTWQVTITAQKNGQTIASKQFSVNATGGM
ncbi:MAG TPA: efflux RND transporter periplasmic adaptor subunit [Bryobacteraceae bacterium]|nr:efflux RND transporter periplasmic adaptor subunit [Bryobacteraceae bacterium]